MRLIAVLKAINPFDQRIRDYMNYALNLDLSMIQQAASPTPMSR